MIIFGGTFDPIHNGHMSLANKLYETFNEPINFMPNLTPPYKNYKSTSSKQRLDMLNLALNNDPRFIINLFEINQKEYFYTEKTLTVLRQEIGLDTPIYFVIGADSLVTLDSWNNWENLFNLTNFVVAARTGYDETKMSEDLFNEFNSRKTSDFSKLTQNAGKIYLLDFPPVDVSSTEVRELIEKNKPTKNLIPHKVYQYIIDNHLYTI